MKILISADIEGVAGVVDPEQCRTGTSEWERARVWFTEEVNAAARGAFDAGATEVVVADSHASFRNLLPDLIDERIYLIMGKPRLYSMVAGVEMGADALMLVGHHSQARGHGILAHTINGFSFSQIRINGVAYGEPGLYGLLAGEVDVPLIFGSGDQILEEENKNFFPEAIWVHTKEAMGTFVAKTKSTQRARYDIFKGARNAVEKFRSSGDLFKPFKVAGPYKCEVACHKPEMVDIFSILPGTKRVDQLTISFETSSILDLIRTVNTFSLMSSVLR
ncbi:M55 family metallopeptidase [Taylorella equigenitalis]|uniref:M55 family metallopeptidase n=1 Tax=Taylorella equigenitalis TaxID=29575 RepID=UPI000428718F|nr:M55 family metallopeptidase [Taylorella equigenitalis]WDU51647.1 M55 family metallopeptidase [Taylorella equigenitalis]WDU53157.1 M55 family metallopeptidase [Taylorella equigenitalis]